MQKVRVGNKVYDLGWSVPGSYTTRVDVAEVEGVPTANPARQLVKFGGKLFELGWNNLTNVDYRNQFQYPEQWVNRRHPDFEPSIMQDREMKVAESVMAGRKAQKPPRFLMAAERMLRRGDSKAEVFKRTGWFKGPEGKMRFEIGDRGSFIKKKPDELKTIYTYDSLGNVMGHEELFRQYPHLRDIDVKLHVEPGVTARGSFTPFQDRSSEGLFDIQPMFEITAPDIKTAHSTLLHEIQHAVQKHEGFFGGGNMARIMEEQNPQLVALANKFADEFDAINSIKASDRTPQQAKRFRELRDKIIPEIREKYTNEAYARYRSIPGEAEAWMVEDRFNNMIPRLRRDYYPDIDAEMKHWRDKLP